MSCEKFLTFILECYNHGISKTIQYRAVLITGKETTDKVYFYIDRLNAMKGSGYRYQLLAFGEEKTTEELLSICAEKKQFARFVTNDGIVLLYEDMLDI